MTKSVFLFRAFRAGSTNGQSSYAAVVVKADTKEAGKAAALAHLGARKVLGNKLTPKTDIAKVVADRVAMYGKCDVIEA